MRFFVGLSFLFLLLTSCQDVEKIPKPEDLISQDKMVEVLTEIALLHGARTYNKKMLEEKGIDPYEYLQEKYQVDSARFVRSNNYYSANYKIYSKIYGRVKERLGLLQVQFDSIREIEERKRDSIRTLEDEDTVKRGQELLRDSLTEDVKPKFLPPPVRRNDSTY